MDGGGEIEGQVVSFSPAVKLSFSFHTVLYTSGEEGEAWHVLCPSVALDGAGILFSLITAIFSLPILLFPRFSATFASECVVAWAALLDGETPHSVRVGISAVMRKAFTGGLCPPSVKASSVRAMGEEEVERTEAAGGKDGKPKKEGDGTEHPTAYTSRN